MIPDKIVQLCTNGESVSKLLAADPTLAPGEAWKKLYGHEKSDSKSTAKRHRDDHTPQDIETALACGKWGPTRPSELFLRVSYECLCPSTY